jgi:hypothetical protein
MALMLGCASDDRATRPRAAAGYIGGIIYALTLATYIRIGELLAVEVARSRRLCSILL